MSWKMIKEGSPFGSTTLKDEKGKPQTVPLNRATRRRLAVQMSTHLERKADQEERHDRMRRILRGVGVRTK